MSVLSINPTLIFKEKRLNLTRKMKADKRKKRIERGIKQNHSSRGNAHRRREWDTIEDKVLYADRRALRNMGEETPELSNGE